MLLSRARKAGVRLIQQLLTTVGLQKTETRKIFNMENRTQFLSSVNTESQLDSLFPLVC